MIANLKPLLPAVLLVMMLNALAASAPRLTGDSTKLHVVFDPGPVAACTVFQSLTETIQTGGKTVPYAPRHCWYFEEKVSSYDDDWAFIQPDGGSWDVWAEIQYRSGATITTQQSNTIRVKY